MKYVKPFLVLLNIMPDRLYNIGDEKIVDTDLIEMDQEIIAKLRNV